MSVREDRHPVGLGERARRLHATSRTSAVLWEQSGVSFGAYSNTFAASYWRRWSVLTAVHRRLELEGAGRADVYRTTADGGSHIFGSRGLRGLSWPPG